VARGSRTPNRLIANDSPIQTDAEGELLIELGDVTTILGLHPQGLSVSSIPGRLGMNCKIVRKHTREGGQVPGYGPQAAQASMACRFFQL
jgi:hypothetical protein